MRPQRERHPHAYLARRQWPARAAVTAAGPETALHNMSYERHLPIVTLLAAGDVEGGREFLRGHMRDASDRILVQMRERATA